MIMIDKDNLSSVLGKLGHKVCSGLGGRKCMRPRRNKGWLCVECHREYMREFMRKRAGMGREEVIDGYNFNQEPGYGNR